jgi:predicted nuclease of predicted toxin-antitoxin system
MKFLADMGVAGRIVDWLRSQGYDVKHLLDERLEKLPDKDIFSKGALEQRIILTFDLDFGEIAAFSKAKDVCTVIFRLHNTRTAHVIDRLASVLSECKKELQRGSIIVVEESRHRIRHLPIGHPES